MDEGPSPSSFRDPSGFLYYRRGHLYRQVQATFRENYDLLFSSGLYGELVNAGSLIPHREVDLSLAFSPDAYKVIEPEEIPFISYPYEWCFSQLKDAALATLRIQKTALDFGMSLRDASAYNIQYRDGKPVLIDTLSFEGLTEGQPWVAYRQFCQHFLAPLALMSFVDVRLAQLLRVHLDGIPLDFTSGLLPLRTRFRPSLMLHVHAHAKSQRRHAAELTPRRRAPRSFSARAFQGLIESLHRAIRKLNWEPEASMWTDYYGEAGSYSEKSIQHKRELVGKLVEEVQPRTVWDVGANTGMFGRMTAERGIPTVSFEMDANCVEISYRAAVKKGETRLLPLVLDLTNPTPSLGWGNSERHSLLERGPVDLTMALALVHHLAIGNNVPLDRVADFLSRTAAWLIVEWVPKEDPKVQQLLAARDDVFENYTLGGFKSAFRRHFTVERTEPISESRRLLFLMRRLPTDGVGRAAPAELSDHPITW